MSKGPSMSAAGEPLDPPSSKVQIKNPVNQRQMKPPTLGQKAKRVAFYRNGDYFDYGVHIPIQGKKHFRSMGYLCDYLTQKTKLPDGVRFIFDGNGKLINDLEDFQDGFYYVVSSNKQFQNLPYGGISRVKTAYTTNALPVREDDLKLFRPLLPKVKDSRFQLPGAENRPLANGKENRVITIVNSSDHSMKSSVLFNIHTPQNFESLLEDLGQSVRLKRVKKMTTINGHQVRSLSQLKQDFHNVEMFFLEGEEVTSSDATSLSPNRRKYYYEKNLSKPIPRMQKKEEKSGYPSKKFELEWVHGYRGRSPGMNLHVLSTEELAYPVASIVVLYDRNEQKQRHYAKHTEDVTCLAIHPSGEVVASGQGSRDVNDSQSLIHVWNVNDLNTLIIIGRNQLEGSIKSIAFSREGYLMLIVEMTKEGMVSLWDWQNDSLVGQAKAEGDQLTGGIFHPSEENLFLTFGMHHLAFWRRANDGFIARKDALSPGHSGRTITSWAFLPDGNLIVGDSSGYLTMWSQMEGEEGFFIIKEVKAHESDVSALEVLHGGTLLSGGKLEKNGHLLAWDTYNNLKCIGRAVLPHGQGGIHAICPQKHYGSDENIYVGTKFNTIVKGSIHRGFHLIVQGHQHEVLDLAADNDQMNFFTTGQDNAICKWSIRSMLWNLKIENKCLCLAVYPRGSAVVAGGSNGKLVTLNSDNGLVVSTISICQDSINALSYSSDGGLLAIGGQDGIIYLYYTQNHGYMYKKSSVLKGEAPIMNLDWSYDDSTIQSVTTNSEYYELVQWNVANQKPLNSTNKKDLDWKEHMCTIGHNITGIWNNVTLKNINYFSCNKSKKGDLLAAGDKDGFVRIFKYPCRDSSNIGYFERKQGSSPVTTIRFFNDDTFFATAGGIDGTIVIWKLL